MGEFLALCIENTKILYAQLVPKFYTVVILPNAKYIIPFCIIIGLYIGGNLIMDSLKRWIGKIP